MSEMQRLLLYAKNQLCKSSLSEEEFDERLNDVVKKHMELVPHIKNVISNKLNNTGKNSEYGAWEAFEKLIYMEAKPARIVSQNIFFKSDTVHIQMAETHQQGYDAIIYTNVEDYYVDFFGNNKPSKKYLMLNLASNNIVFDRYNVTDKTLFNNDKDDKTKPEVIEFNKTTLEADVKSFFKNLKNKKNKIDNNPNTKKPIVLVYAIYTSAYCFASLVDKIRNDFLPIRKEYNDVEIFIVDLQDGNSAKV